MNSRKPPQWALGFLRWYCKEDYLEDLEGDLTERFELRSHAKNPKNARLHFVLDVLNLCRPGMIKEFRRHKSFSPMLLSHFIMALRSAKKERTFSVLNVLGLAIGFSACIYIGVYTLDEFRYDKFHEHGSNIYRINQTFIWGETDKLFGSTGPGVMPAILEEVPEFEVMTRVHPLGDQLVTSFQAGHPKVFEETRLYAVDSTFFDVFTFPLIKGNPEKAMVNPNSIILTESMAKKYFGDDDAFGQQVLLGEEDNPTAYQVTGIAKDVPRNSHIQFNALTSLSSIPRMRFGGDTWWWTTFVTFGRLRPDADPEQVASKVAQVPGKYLGPFLQKYQGITYEEFLASGEEWDLYIQPLTDIRLFSHHVFSRLNQTTDIKTIYTMGSIAALILLLSIINFVNLTTARATKRAREVGIRKTLGSRRSSLISQFLMEAIFFCTLAAVLSYVILYLMLPFMDFITAKSLPQTLLIDPYVLISTLIAVVIIGWIAGLYPALVLSGFRPLDVMKGKMSHGRAGIYTRNTLMVIQFTVSIGLIAGALIIKQHVNHWMAMDLGYNRDNKLIIEDVNRLKHSMDAFQREIAGLAAVEAVSFSSDTPPYVWDNDEGFRLSGLEKEAPLSYMTIDEHFMDIYDLKLVAGESFSGSLANRNEVLVDESLIAAFDITDPNEAIGRTLIKDTIEARIIGVFQNLTTEINWEQLPIALYYKGASHIHRPTRVLSVTLKDEKSATEMTELLQTLEKKWSSFNNNSPFRYSFSDQEYEQIFAPGIRLGKVINLYALLAIFIAGLGLTGLLAYMIERRNKELGVRKVLGAPISHLLKLLTLDFAKLIGIGFFLSSAITWWVMHRWSEEFVYQSPIEFWTFLIAGIIMLSISLVTMSFQSVKAASSNPIEYLREE